jgi:hypothetical protein
VGSRFPCSYFSQKINYCDGSDDLKNAHFIYTVQREKNRAYEFTPPLSPPPSPIFCLITLFSGTAIIRNMCQSAAVFTWGLSLLTLQSGASNEMDTPHCITTPKREWSSQANPLKMFFFYLKIWGSLNFANKTFVIEDKQTTGHLILNLTYKKFSLDCTFPFGRKFNGKERL